MFKNHELKNRREHSCRCENPCDSNFCLDERDGLLNIVLDIGESSYDFYNAKCKKIKINKN